MKAYETPTVEELHWQIIEFVDKYGEKWLIENLRLLRESGPAPKRIGSYIRTCIEKNQYLLAKSIISHSVHPLVISASINGSEVELDVPTDVLDFQIAASDLFVLCGLVLDGDRADTTVDLKKVMSDIAQTSGY
jgi:hypothetical protein